MSEARVAARYATSIFDLAKERNIIDEVRMIQICFYRLVVPAGSLT